MSILIMGNTNSTREENLMADYDISANLINRGTADMPKPQLRFHQVCGTNIQLLKDLRVAKRKESFCKGLAFSNRPISIEEIVCLRLSEVGTNWSGVMRFGVTNVDPASFRDIELPKFACPDLTSKGGYWAKSLSERYSVEASLLHFCVNKHGDMYYGVNGVNKGIFISGINTSLPLWIILDIYGNSIALEFIDSNEISMNPLIIPRRTESSSTLQNTGSEEIVPLVSQLTITNDQHRPPTTSSSDMVNNLLTTANISSHSISSARFSSRTSSERKLCFHDVKGMNIALHNEDTVAIRKRGEYSLGYVFTDRPIKIEERLVILVGMVEDAYSGGLAFGLTSCDPTHVPASRLPVDSDELLERPEYWICIKDVGACPQIGDKLSFRVDSSGRVFFSKNDAPERVIVHVDISIPLWAFFDLYGSTRKIQIIDLDPMNIQSLSGLDLARSNRASSEGSSAARETSTTHERLHRPNSATWTPSGSIRVVLPADSGASLAVPSTSATTSSRLSPSTQTSTTLEPSDLVKLRVELASKLRRINNETRERDGETSASPSRERRRNESLERRRNIASSPMTISSALSIGDDSYSRSPRNNPDRDLPSVAEILASRRRLIPPTSSPITSLSSSPRESRIGTRATAFAEQLFEASSLPSRLAHQASDSPSASITVPTVPPPLSSSLAVSSDDEQNKKNRALEFPQSVDDSPDDDFGTVVDGGRIENECSICMNHRVNAVIYRCGHMCMCFACAKETRKRSGDCPICRSPIIDIIRAFPS